MEEHPRIGQLEATPTLHDICTAHWPTLAYVPNDIRDEWADIFMDCLSAFIRQSTTSSLTQLFLCSKGLLAAVRHGGKSRQEAVNRTLRARVRLWRAGRFGELWQRLLSDHSKRTSRQRQTDDNNLQKEARRVARLVDEGQLSRAAAQLCSRGLAPDNAETREKIRQLFPPGQLPHPNHAGDAPSLEFQAAAVKKVILQTPNGLAAGCSGLRAEHLKALLTDRNIGRAAKALDLLTK